MSRTAKIALTAVLIISLLIAARAFGGELDLTDYTLTSTAVCNMKYPCGVFGKEGEDAEYVLVLNEEGTAPMLFIRMKDGRQETVWVHSSIRK